MTAHTPITKHSPSPWAARDHAHAHRHTNFSHALWVGGWGGERETEALSQALKTFRARKRISLRLSPVVCVGVFRASSYLTHANRDSPTQPLGTSILAAAAERAQHWLMPPLMGRMHTRTWMVQPCDAPCNLCGRGRFKRRGV